MTIEGSKERWQEVREIHKEYKFFYQISGGAIFIVIGIIIGSYIFEDDEGYLINLFTDLLSICATVLMLNLLARRREERTHQQILKQRLIFDVSSSSNDIAKRAIEEMRYQGWLSGENSLLKGARLSGANLEGADLRNANLEGAELSATNLKSSNLQNVNFRSCDLYGTNFENSNLAFSDFQEAQLISAHLNSCLLYDANLKSAYVYDVTFDENTMLPNGDKWTKNTDLKAFGVKMELPDRDKLMIVLKSLIASVEGEHRQTVRGKNMP